MAFLTAVVRPETAGAKKEISSGMNGAAAPAFSRRRQRRYR